jgi:Rha family phage regulatory protein
MDLARTLRLHESDQTVVVNSRDVARVFGKQHKDVLKSINGLEIGEELRRSWFRPVTYLDDYGREQPSVDMTRDGFTLLVMGYTGQPAMAFKVAYIQAFNEMEARLRTQGGMVTQKDLLASVREIVAPLSTRLISTDGAIERLQCDVDTVKDDVRQILRVLPCPRRLTSLSKREHIHACFKLFSGLCPCCTQRKVVNDIGEKMPDAQFDHFFTNQRPEVSHTWLICSQCHLDLTTDHLTRDQVAHHFNSYQVKRRSLAGAQGALF